MNDLIRTLTKTISYIAFLGLVAGCSTTATNVESVEQMALSADMSTEKVVFGKFRLVRNGEEVSLGESVFANSAKLHLVKDGSTREIIGEVGEDGKFAWALPAGSYQVSSIAFHHRGQRIEPETEFSFTVSADHEASYVGTITLEATFESGYHGTNGMVERFTVSNDCETECDDMLYSLGMAQDSAAMSLLSWDTRVASNR